MTSSPVVHVFISHADIKQHYENPKQWFLEGFWFSEQAAVLGE